MVQGIYNASPTNSQENKNEASNKSKTIEPTCKEDIEVKQMMVGVTEQSYFLENGCNKLIQDEFQNGHINSGIKSNGISREVYADRTKTTNFSEDRRNFQLIGAFRLNKIGLNIPSKNYLEDNGPNPIISRPTSFITNCLFVSAQKEGREK